MTKVYPNNQKGERNEELIHEVQRRVQEATKLSAMNVPSVGSVDRQKHNVRSVKKDHIGSSKFITTFLGCTIVLLTLAMSWLVHVKLNEGEGNRIDLVVAKPEQSTDHLTQNQVEIRMDQVQDRIDAIERQMRIWNHRTWLLALAVNENANISQGIDNQYHRHNPHHGYIAFDRAWRMNRMPNTMGLTESERQRILKNIK